jgi:hypothetical protein
MRLIRTENGARNTSTRAAGVHFKNKKSGVLFGFGLGNFLDQFYYNPEAQDCSRLNSYDVTLNGLPCEIGELESFNVDHATYDGTQPTIPTATTGDIYFSDVLTGVLFKGIQG